jgi:penicillin-binding protein 1A
MATAYATIANEGRKVTPTAIEKVVRNEGQEDEEVLYQAPQKVGEQVIAPEIARRATAIMVGNVTRGIAWKASLGDRPVAGKTGTSENFFDAWFIGFTPQLVTGVWMGYGEGGKNLDGLLNVGSRTQQGPLAPPPVVWQTYMQRILKDKPIKKFEGIEIQQTSAPAEDPRIALSGDSPLTGVAPPEGTAPVPPPGGPPAVFTGG